MILSTTQSSSTVGSCIRAGNHGLKNEKRVLERSEAVWREPASLSQRNSNNDAAFGGRRGIYLVMVTEIWINDVCKLLKIFAP